jgi:hypothetical protein
VVRFVAAAAVVAMSLPSYVASVAPSPFPALETFLVAPADPIIADDPGALPFPAGTVSASQWATLTATGTTAEEAELRRDGFVTGIAKAWSDDARKHVLIAAIAAFSGGRGATAWMTGYGPRAGDPHYVRSGPIAGIDHSIVAHYADTAAPVYADRAAYVKGNDYFFVFVTSRTDDLAMTAEIQATRQNDVAPAETIPQNAWPENAPSPTSSAVSSSTGNVILIVFIVAGVLVIGVVVALVLIARRSQGPATVPASVATPPPALQMSPDGYYWWDGQAWKEASREAPPVAVAQRSADGYYWWDGQKWREVPGA